MWIAVYFTQALQKSFHVLNILTQNLLLILLSLTYQLIVSYSLKIRVRQLPYLSYHWLRPCIIIVVRFRPKKEKVTMDSLRSLNPIPSSKRWLQKIPCLKRHKVVLWMPVQQCKHVILLNYHKTFLFHYFLCLCFTIILEINDDSFSPSFFSF
jgi:hypothetical protein